MTTLRTPAQAVAFALTQARWDHAMCLNFVWRCYAPDDSISSALAAQGYPPPINRAIDGWNASPMKHADRSPAIGAPVYYTAASGGATAGDGHVAIYVGGGMIRSSDAGGYGINATVPLDWPERNWGRRMLGWTGDILGHALDLTNTAGGSSSPLKPKQEDDMGKFVQHPAPNLSVAYVGPDLSFTVLNDMDEVRSIEALGLAKQAEMVKLPDALIWNKLAGIAARKPK